jgi:molecular chaperone GrpE (heat shock protein)
VSGDPNECRKHAAKCRRLAETAPNEMIAADFEELAQRFLKVADDLERAEARVAALRGAEKLFG